MNSWYSVGRVLPSFKMYQYIVNKNITLSSIYLCLFQKTKCPPSSPQLAPNLHFDYPHLCVGLCFNCLQGTPVFPVTHVVHSSHLKQNHKYSFILILLSPPVIYTPTPTIHRDSAPTFIFHISWKKCPSFWESLQAKPTQPLLYPVSWSSMQYNYIKKSS